MKKNLSPGNNVVGNDLVTKPHQHHIILPSKYVRKVARSIRTRQSTVTPVAGKKKKGTKKKKPTKHHCPDYKRSNQSILKELSPEHLLQELMLKLQ